MRGFGKTRSLIKVASQLSTVEEILEEMRSIARRLRAARLAAGFAVSKDAAEAVSVNAAGYRAVENATTRASEKLLHSATKAFGVSITFLVDGHVESPTDRLASRLLWVIETFEENGPEAGRSHPGEFAMRLRDIRMRAGYETVRSVVESKGWSLGTYTMHETGANAIPLDRQIAYALSLGARPEYAVFGDLPADEPEFTSWQDRRVTNQPGVTENGVSWSWLRGTSRSRGVPILQLKNTRPQLIDDRLFIPAIMLGMPEFLSDDATWFAYLPPTATSGTYLIDPLRSDGTMAFMMADGTVELGPSEGRVATDPTKSKLTDGKILLGGFVARIEILVHGA